MPSFKPYISLGMMLVLFGILLSMIDLNHAVRVLSQARLGMLLYAGLISLSFPVLCAIRWSLLCRILGIPIGFCESFKMIMAAWPLGAITPAKSGDLIKIVFLQDKLPYSTSAGIVLAERVMDVFVLGGYALVFGFGMKLPAGIFTGAVVLGAVAVYFGLVFSQWTRLVPALLRKKVENAAQASRVMCSHPVGLTWMIGVTALNWFLTFYQTGLCYQALQTTVPIGVLTAGLPVAIFAGLLPVTPAGMGTRDAAVMILFADYASPETNLSVGILYSIYGYWLLAMLGIPFMRSALQGSLQHISGNALTDQLR